MSQRKHGSKKELSGTPTKIATRSPSKHGQGPSPLATSKYQINSASKPTVSYGELQIVLQNIQQIRKKANAQINELTLENQSLREQLLRAQQDNQDISSRLNKSSFTKREFQTKIIEQLEALENEKRLLDTDLREKVKSQTDLKAKLAELRLSIEQEKQAKEELSRKIDESNNRWKWAFDILAGDHQRGEQLIWKVKNDVVGGVWELLQKAGQLNNTIRIHSQKAQILQRELLDSKGSCRQTTSLLEKTIEEVAGLNLKLSKSEEQSKRWRQQFIKKQQELQTAYIEKQQILNGHKKDILNLQGKMKALSEQKELNLQKLRNHIGQVQEKLIEKQQMLDQKQKQENYRNLIGDICQQSEDYSMLLQRLRYLEKFKAEHYYNVQKIQYLCKMLDS